MRRTTLGLAMVLAAIIALTLAACGATGSAAPGGSSGATSGGTTSGGASIQTRTVTAGGTSETALTDATGMTLYYFTPDASGQPTCTGSCASMWPPLLSAGGTPTSAASLPGTLAVVSGGNGQQVEYNGHPLYTYSGDQKPGDTNGNGLFGKWFVATPVLAAQGGSSGSSGNGGYGSGY